jgi:hypothetical protein
VPRRAGLAGAARARDPGRRAFDSESGPAAAAEAHWQAELQRPPRPPAPGPAGPGAPAPGPTVLRVNCPAFQSHGTSPNRMSDTLTLSRWQVHRGFRVTGTQASKLKFRRLGLSDTVTTCRGGGRGQCRVTGTVTRDLIRLRVRPGIGMRARAGRPRPPPAQRPKPG